VPDRPPVFAAGDMLGSMGRRMALLVIAMLAGAGCSVGHAVRPAGPASATGAPAATAGCATVFTLRPLPVWARAGFSPPTTPMPYVMGAGGNIVAILWGNPDYLRAPPRAEPRNKILWVSRLGVRPGASLLIRATLNGGGRSATRVVTGGPGPSLIDLPAAGCWTFNLSWSGHHDRLSLRYLAG
jgi:hypothetical protein